MTAPTDATPEALGVDEAAFLAGITEALTDRGPTVELPNVDTARVVTPDNNLVGRFTEMATAAGMQVHAVSTPDEAAQYIVDLARDQNQSHVLVQPEAFPARAEIVATLQSIGLTFIDADQPDAAFDAELGITGVRMAVAETGSLVVESGPNLRRMASLAVSVHVAVMRPEQIVADLLDWAQAIDRPVPSSNVLITGPSKTADIELNLVTGVHGPREVHVLILSSTEHPSPP